MCFGRVCEKWLTIAQQADISSYITAIDDMKTDPKGHMHFADDGIVRSYSGTGKVLDFVRLTNTQLLHSINAYGPVPKETETHLNEVWADVDGSNISDEHALDPPEIFQSSKFRNGGTAIAPRTTPNAAHEARMELEGKILWCLGTSCIHEEECTFGGCFRCAERDMSVYFYCVLRPGSPSPSHICPDIRHGC